MEEKTKDISNVKIEIKDKEEGVYFDGKKLLYEPDTDYELKSCCGMTVCNIEKPLLEVLLKFIISASVLTFSMIQMANNRGDTSYFASSISLILGIYINNSQDKNEKKKK